jgi:dimethylglycine dehydrogenase
MTTHTRVAIVGGGIMGVSLLYHLTKEGWRDVTLVEKGELTSGSTWHAAALVPHFTASAMIAKMTSYASRLYGSLERETGQTAGWHGCGSLRLALDDDQVDHLRYTASVLRAINVECHLIGADDIPKLNPLLNLDGVRLAAYTPYDGHTDPNGTTQALALGARSRGATITRRNRVVDMRQRPTDEWELTTEHGTIVAEHVVNAAGFFAPQVAAMVSLRLPIVTLLHQFLITEEVPEVTKLAHEFPVTRDPRASSYYRQEQKGILIGPFEPDPPVWGLDGLDWSVENYLAAPDLERIVPLMEWATKRVPVLERVGIRRTINGPLSHTPDGLPLLGAAANLKNYWLATGTNLGIALGAGCGKNLALLMVHDESEDYVRGMDPRRYGDWAMANSYRIPKAQDVFAEVYRKVHFPGETMLAGRPLRTSPLYERLKQQGATFGENCGWEQPQWFVPPGTEVKHSFRRTTSFRPVLDECRVVRDHAGVLDLSTFSKYEVSGRDAYEFLDRLCANKLPKQIGAIGLVHMLNEHGGIESEATLTKLTDTSFYLVSATSAELYDLDWLQKHRRPTDAVDIRNVSEERAVIVISGPDSRSVIQSLTTDDLGSAAFPWRHCRNIRLAGRAVQAMRISYVGELGWELHLNVKDALHLYDAILGEGEAYKIANYGLLAVNAMRMEKAHPAWGWELTTEITPIEAGMQRFVDFGKTFIGRDAVISRFEKGPETKLAYLSVTVSDADAIGGEVVLDNDLPVGVVTSGAYGPTVDKTLAFAYVKTEFASLGRKLSIDILGNRCTATVLSEPAYDPRNTKLRA